MLLNIENVSKSYGDRQILDDVTMYMTPGMRLGVVGVNGCGKSTLLRLAAGAESPDSGSVSTDPNVRIAYLRQDPAYDPGETVLDYVLDGQPENSRELASYEAEEILGKLGGIDPSAKMGELSGGQCKRAALAQCLVGDSDLLVLDEPTNHLDFAMIRWLEDYLSRFSGAVLFVSHDRYFLENLATETAEVSFGRLFRYEGGYSAWLDGKARREEMEAASERKRQSTLRRELIWVLQGPCARGTKSRERLERYAALKAQQPPQTGAELTDLRLTASRMGKKTIELKGIRKSYGGKTVIPPFDFLLARDDRVGIVGLNGSGKSTLLNIISGRLAPDGGIVTIGDTVRIGYFSQHGEELDGEQTALEYVKEKGSSIETSEGRMSASKLMELFLFPSELQYRKISKLSGGEKRRLFLLGILAESPNVLLLDEPTNDLDIPTMRVLEDYLLGFPGAVIAVSHDRYFLDRICRRVFVIEPGKEIQQSIGGFTDYAEHLSAASKAAVREPKKEVPKEEKKTARKPRMSYNEQREFSTIDDDIAALEKKLADVKAEAEASASDYVRLMELEAAQQKLEAELEAKMERWMYLTELNETVSGN